MIIIILLFFFNWFRYPKEIVVIIAIKMAPVAIDQLIEVEDRLPKK